MCDIEPSILARNAVLFKLIMDNDAANRIWCIFYAQVIDQECTDVLQKCALDLLSVGSDLDAWHATDIGKLVRFCDQHTYTLVRSIWGQYAKGRLSDADETAKLKYGKEFRSKYMKKEFRSLDTMYHIYPTGLEARRDVSMHVELADEFRSVGIVPSSIYSTSGARTFLNPMVLRGTAQKHDLHYTVDPTMGFHKTMAYIKTSEGPLHSDDRRVGTPDKELIYTVCFRQFTEWCSAFREIAACDLVVTYSHCGDALEFCDTLAADRGPLTSTLSSTSLQLVAHTLQPVVRRIYDVIDTSNVCDSVGLLNMLCVAHRILCPLRGVLFTGTLSTVSDKTDGLAGFLEQELMVELTTFMALTNLNYMDSHHSHSTNYAELMQATTIGLMGSGKGPLPLPPGEGRAVKSARTMEWRLSSPPGQVAVLHLSNESFISLFFGIYKTMFKDMLGDGWSMSTRMQAVKDMMRKADGQNKFALPTIQTFVRLVAWAAQHVSGIDRPAVFVDLLDALQGSGLVLQDKVHRELLLYMRRFLLIPFGYERTNRLRGLYDPISHPVSPYRNDSSPFYSITLLVPRTAAERLKKFPSTVLCMTMGDNQMIGGGVEVLMMSLNMFFVKHRALSTDDDWEARKSTADIIFKNFALVMGDADDYEYVAFSCCSIKNSLVVRTPDRTFVWLCLSPTPDPNFAQQVKEFGVNLVVFSTTLAETALVCCQNVNEDEFCRPLYAPVMPVATGQEVVASFSPGGSILEISCTLPFPADTVSENDMPAFSTPAHPLRVEIRLGKVSVQQSFPSGMDLARPIAQIRLKSQYMEVTVRPARARPPKRMFPLFLIAGEDHHRALQLWGLSRVVLDSLPVLDLSAPDVQLKWIYTLAGAQMASNEREGHTRMSNPPPLTKLKATKLKATVTKLKATVHAILCNLAGFNSTKYKWPKLFCLSRGQDIHTIALYVNAVRVDLTSSSVVLDLAFCYLTVGTAQSIIPMFLALGDIGIHSIRMTDEEHDWWMEAGPALQERARDGWVHKAGCEYFAGRSNHITIPRRDHNGDLEAPSISPICSCGCGDASLRDTPFYKQYAEKHPDGVAQFTRLAVSPLYPVFAGLQLEQQATAPFGRMAVAASQSSAEVSRQGRCDACHKPFTTLSACSRCKKVHYCGRECQKTHWSTHKAKCSK